MLLTSVINNFCTLDTVNYEKHMEMYTHFSEISSTMSWLRWLVTILSLWRFRLNPCPLHLGFMVYDVAMGKVFSQ